VVEAPSPKALRLEVSIPVRGRGFVKTRLSSHISSKTPIVSIPVRGRGFVKSKARPGTTSPVVRVSIPVRGRGFVKDKDYDVLNSEGFHPR
jgi:hypothetical protein